VSGILLHVFMKWAARVVWSRSARMMRGPAAQAEHMPLPFSEHPEASGVPPFWRRSTLAPPESCFVNLITSVRAMT
jgi:hypothetical protein